MAAPVGTCYPSSIGQARFSRTVSFTYAYFLKRVWKKKITDTCDSANNTGWEIYANFPPFEAGRDTFNFTLEFEFNIDFQLGDDPRTMYKCTNVNNYIAEFNDWYDSLSNIASLAADADSISGVPSSSPCSKGPPPCPPITGNVTTERARDTSVAGIELMQANTPGCGP